MHECSQGVGEDISSFLNQISLLFRAMLSIIEWSETRKDRFLSKMNELMLKIEDILHKSANFGKYSAPLELKFFFRR